MNSNMNFDNGFPNFEEFTSSFQKDSSNSSNADTSIPFGNIDMNTILKIKQVMEKMNQNKNDPRSNLLLSLKPYLKPSRKQKVDQYIQLLNMGSIMENFNPMGGEKTKWCILTLFLELLIIEGLTLIILIEDLHIMRIKILIIMKESLVSLVFHLNKNKEILVAA